MQMRAKLSSFGVDPYDLSIISQTECPKHPNGTSNGVNINIDPETFSSHNIGEAVRKTGTVIGEKLRQKKKIKIKQTFTSVSHR